MNKNKLQSLINELQKHLDDAQTEETADVGTVGEAQTNDEADYYVSNGDGSSIGRGIFLRGSGNEYFKITSINGKPFKLDEIGSIEIDLPGYFDVEVDYDKYLEDNNLEETNTSEGVIKIYGLLKSVDGYYVGNLKCCYICEAGTDRILMPIEVFASTYCIPVQRIKELTGTYNFRFYIENPASAYPKDSEDYIDTYPHEIFDIESQFFAMSLGEVNEIYIEREANKTKYLAGELFDPTGIVLKAKMSLGAIMGIGCQVVNAHLPLKASDTYVKLKYFYKNESFYLNHPIRVVGQSLDVRLSLYTRTKSNNEWGIWALKTAASNKITVTNDGITESKTKISFFKDDIDLGKQDVTGLKLLVKCAKTSRTVSHVKLDGIVYALPDSGRAYLYLGKVGKGESENKTIDVEYVDADLELIPETTVYYCSSLDPMAQSERKTLNLAGGVACSLDLFHGNVIFSFDDVNTSETPLDAGVSHVFNPDEVNSYYGANFRLNLYERLEFAEGLDKYFLTPVYTDATGAKYTFKVLYYINYYSSDDEKKGYLSEEQISQIKEVGGKLIFDNNEVQVEYLKIGSYNILTDKPSENVRGHAKYLQLKGTSKEPVYWLNAGATNKGFDKNGRMTLIIDEFQRYIEMTYDALDRITKINDGNENFMIFSYDTGDRQTLKKLTDSRGREIEYYYDAEDCLVEIKYNAPDGNNYKTINLEYESIKEDDVSAFAISEIRCSDTTRSLIEYRQLNDLEYRVKSITHFSKMDSTEEEQIYSFVFGFNNATLTTDITDDCDNVEKYVFADDGSTKEYFQIRENKVICAEYFNYVPFEKQEKTVVSNEFLNLYAYEQFTSDEIQAQINAADNEYTETVLNGQNLPESTKTVNIKVTDNSTKEIFITFSYDPNCLLKTKRTYITYSDGTPFMEEIYYFYDANGKLTGKNVAPYHGKGRPIYDYLDREVFTYDENGCVTQVKRERSDPYSGYTGTLMFYANREYDSNKLPVKEFDETGKYTTHYVYKDKTNLVKGVMSHNYALVSYDYGNEDRLSKVEAIGQSGDTFTNRNSIEHLNGELSLVTSGTGGTKIEYTYDAKRRPLTVKLNDDTYETYEYNDGFKNRTGYYDEAVMTNANGESFAARAYRDGTKEELFYNDATILNRAYDKDGNLTGITDSLANNRISISYDTCGNPISYTDGNHNENYTFDIKGQVTQIEHTGDVERTDKYTYEGNLDDYIKAISTGEFSVQLRSDLEHRYKGKYVYINGAVITSEEVTYVQEDGRDTHMPSMIQYSNTKYEYTYDSNGNISEIKKDGEIISRHKYDYLNRLIRDDCKSLNTSTVYKYDGHGNISKRQIWAFTMAENPLTQGMAEKTYEYDENGRLKRTYWSYRSHDENEFMSEENPVIYDSLGNPLKWTYGEMTWTRGRKLIKYGSNTFEYDALGRRMKKNDITYSYDSQGRLIKQSNGLEFFYDTTGVMGFTYDGESYVYRKDMQGNIIAILDSNKEVVVEYSYDAWGRHTVSGDYNIGNNINPFRYRGYYYDIEMRMYYLQTRYYDPYIGRFINADSINYANPSFLNGLNLYAYCNNNPVMNVDPEGTTVISFSAFATMLEYLCATGLSLMASIAQNLGRFNIFKSINGVAGSAGNLIGVIATAATLIDVGVNLFNDIKSGKDIIRSLTDSSVDLALGIGTIFLTNAITGFFAGSAIPVVGNLIGFAVGFGVSIGAYLIDTYAPQVIEVIKDVVYETVTCISAEVSGFINAINNFFSNLGNKIFGW